MQKAKQATTVPHPKVPSLLQYPFLTQSLSLSLSHTHTQLTPLVVLDIALNFLERAISRAELLSFIQSAYVIPTLVNLLFLLLWQ